MKTTGMIVLALMIGTASCKSEKNASASTVEQQTEVASTEIVAENETLDEVELPAFGNFQLDSKGEVITLVGFYPENGMQIFDFVFDQESGTPNEKCIYSGDYHVVGQPKNGVYTVVFNLTSADGKTKKTGRMKMEYKEQEGELPIYLITPLKGYDLGLPAGKTTEVPISAWQAWD